MDEESGATGEGTKEQETGSVNCQSATACCIVVNSLMDQRSFLVKSIKDTSGCFTHYEKVISDYKEQVERIDANIMIILNG